MATDSAGNAYVVGYTTEALPGQVALGEWDLIVRKFDPSGSELWTRQIGTAGREGGPSVAVDPGGSVVISGYTVGAFPGYAAQGKPDAFVMKLNDQGTTQWVRQFGTAGSDFPRAVDVDGLGNVVVTGDVEGALPGQTYSGKPMAFVRKYDSSGTEVWTRQFGTDISTNPFECTVDPAGNVFIVGATYGAFPGYVNGGPGGTVDAFVRKYNSDGEEQWTTQWGGTERDYATSIAQGANGDLIVAGYVSGAKSFLVKLDAAGNQVWSKQASSYNSVYPHYVEIDSVGIIVLAGWAQTSVDGTTVSGVMKSFVRTFNQLGDPLTTRYLETARAVYLGGLALGADDAQYVTGWTTGVFPTQTNAGAEDVFVAKLLP